MSLVPQGIEYRREQNDEEFHETSRRTFEVSYKIVLKMCSTSQIFPEIIISGIIPILHRLQEPMSVTKGNEELMAVVQRYCANLIRAMTGFENDTYGWREGYIMRYLLTKDSSDKMDQMTVNIPLLYQKHSSTLRKFEMKAKSWSKILEMLINSDDVTFYRFEDCTLALCSICVALGIKWTPHDPEHRLPMLSHPPSNLHKAVGISSSDSTNATESSSNHEENRVKLILDDGTIFTVEKDLLLESSPVFTAMFNGHFIESGQQQVLLPGVSKGAVTLLLDQIFMQRQANKLPNGVANGAISQQYDLATIFELFRLADRFLLEDVYERALNTLMTKCICPNSAPIIYAESVRLVTLRKSESSQMMGLSSYILMYVLTAENIRMPERCNAVRKIFDSVVPTHVVEDLKALIEFHMYKN
ncbi:unnamed protein product [Orchesella dallaii]|uniref:BTB domain-containing protein n=1 Tax=Orchesella dallaii TaxID=48710 RepID=A0ABP1QTT5_9HEXA